MVLHTGGNDGWIQYVYKDFCELILRFFSFVIKVNFQDFQERNMTKDDREDILEDDAVYRPSILCIPSARLSRRLKRG